MYGLYLWNIEDGWKCMGWVDGVEFAWDAYKALFPFAEVMGKTVAMIDGETGEVLAEEVF